MSQSRNRLKLAKDTDGVLKSFQPKSHWPFVLKEPGGIMLQGRSRGRSHAAHIVAISKRLEAIIKMNRIGNS